MDYGTVAPTSPGRPLSAGATPQPETAEQRRARRKAWGREWGAVMREHSQRIKAREGR